MTPIRLPWTMKIRMMVAARVPMVLRIAISLCLSTTIITNVDTMLNAAITTMKNSSSMPQVPLRDLIFVIHVEDSPQGPISGLILHWIKTTVMKRPAKRIPGRMVRMMGMESA